ncbi:MAG TPA: hypothetical protein VFW78_12560 [Bacteroidia bacterium]|nr:hypothetical protein [Bacteroidia bacterium]
MEPFEETLSNMSLPETGELQHRHLLSGQIIQLKEERNLTLWWVTIPLFLIAAFYMRSCYMHNSFTEGLETFINDQKMPATWLFVIAPALLIVLNAFRIKKIYFLAGSPKLINLVSAVWMNLAMITIAVGCIILYFTLIHLS